MRDDQGRPMHDELIPVPPTDWHARASAARAAGAVWFDWITCVDEIGQADALRVILRAAQTPDAPGVRLETLIDRDEPVLDSVRDVWAGASWHEREVRDFFGVTFTGGDPRPLLLRPDFGGHPLRRDAVLAARVVESWPGAKEPGEGSAAGRRRMVPPGVPDPAVWGERVGEPADAAEVAASVAGGRVRRRTGR